MGLDMYAFKSNGKDKPVEIFYWRKHPDLHGFMERLYRRRGGTGQFNCEDGVDLTPADIDALEEAVTKNRLPHTEGFFFGQSFPEHKEQDLQFIKAAREALAEGCTVFYTSWW